MNNWKESKKSYNGVVLYRFEYIKQYYSAMSEYIKCQLSETEEMLDKLNSADEDTRDMYYEDYELEHYRIKKIFEDNFTKSILTSLYSLIEYNIIFVCKRLDHELNINEYIKPRQAIVKQSTKYIIDKLGIRLSQSSEQFITVINTVRNIFTHSNGRLDDVDNNTINTLVNFSNYSGVTGLIVDIQEKEINITLDFIDYYIRQTKEYFKEIFQC